MSRPDVVLHIGQPKTGTTTFQRLLAQNRQRLSEVGALYPDPGENQWLAMADVLLQDPEARVRTPAGVLRHMTELRKGSDGQFARLAQQCREATGSTIIISAENLVYAGAYTVDRLYDVFGPAQVNVVITTKPASSLLCSAYQQLARTQAVDDFDSWIRTALDDLIAGRDGSIVGWVRTDLLRSHWTRPGWQTTLIDMNGRPENTTASLWQQVVPRLPAPELVAVENRGYPAALVAATQEFIRHHSHMSVSQFRDTQRRAFAAHLRDPDYGALGRFKLKPDVEACLDRAYPHAGTVAVVDRYVGQLHERLQSSEPVTYVDLDSGVSQRDWRKKVAAHSTLLNRVQKPLLTHRAARRVRTRLRLLRRVVGAE